MPSGSATQLAKTLVGKRILENRPENTEVPELHNRIAIRAYELYEDSGRVHGRDLENWLQAEQEILGDRMNTDLG